ncbi:hypothetical protein RUM43_003735 [Polyplax serrata]|uniref:FACT complex subunit SSRP1 n=1 Tax=Polyplax serrata TaxID=468196 RepID=A0AAN8P0I4_POLSC
MDVLEYNDISAENKGAMTPGRLKLTDQYIIFKNNKTGKVEQIGGGDIDTIHWQKFVGTCGLRLFLKNGTLHRFRGFKEGEQTKLAHFFSSNYKKEMTEKELSLKGWNWGTAKFSGSILNFEVGHHTAFEIPLNYVSQCTTGKNEVTVEFHQNDDAPVNLMEMRFHIPSSEIQGEDPVDAFYQNVMSKASVINVSGDALAIFREIQCLTPRGRYDIKVFNSFFQLHGKTFDYKIPASTVLRLFLLPHHDKRQIFFVVSLDPPIKQGQTRYHFLVCLFPQGEDEISIELPYSEEELKEKFEGKLEKEMKGQTYEVLANLMKTIVGRKLTVPSFTGKADTPAIACSYKAAAGYLYPMERGFIYVHKPPFYIRFEEIASVNFARSGGSTRSFDFEVELKNGVIHTFSSIEKDEYEKMFDFIASKKLIVKNRGKTDKPNYNDDLIDSDQENDAYLVRVKREAEERDENGDGESNDEESTDEDFNPNQEESDVAEEYDSNAPTTDSDDEGGSDASSKEKKEKKHKKAKTVSEKPRKKKKEKKAKDSNAPKRPQSAYFIWMSENREKLKEEYPSLSMTELAKKAGEVWRELKDKTEWNERAKKAKADYEVALKKFKESGGENDGEKAKSNKKVKGSSSPSKAVPSGGFKSKEYLSDSDSSTDGEKKKTAKKEEGESDKQKKQSDRTKSEKDLDKGKKRKASDDESQGKRKKISKKNESDDDNEDDDDYPEEPEESTPPTTEESEESGSD